MEGLSESSLLMIYPVLDYKCLKKDRRSSRTITFHICQRWQDFNCLKCLWSQSIATTRSSIFIPILQSGKCNQVNLAVQKQGPGDRRFTFNISTNQSEEIMRAKQSAKTVIALPAKTKIFNNLKSILSPINFIFFENIQIIYILQAKLQNCNKNIYF